MAGLGRRTHYRKHLTDSVLNDLPEPQPHERIAKVVATRGGNQFDILVAESAAESALLNESDKEPQQQQQQQQESPSRTPQLAILPTKFHKLVWVKRNDYVIVQTGTTDEDHHDDNEAEENKTIQTEKEEPEPLKKTTPAKEDTGGGVRYIISHILYKDQIKHLQTRGLWPSADPEFNKIENNNTSENASVVVAAKEGADDGIVYADDYGYDSEEGENLDDLLFVNTNRVAAMKIQDDDGDSSEEED
jgi:probable RNA-binding protein EIF1AD